MSNFQKKKPYIGHLDQVYQIRRSMLLDGRGQGLRVIDVSDGRLSFTLLVDRCLDLHQLSYRGQNLAYIAPVGPSAPQFFEAEGDRFLYNFSAGFLTTCGFGNIGSPGEDGGEKLGLHGRIGNQPASSVQVRVDEEEGTPFVEISAEIREARLFLKNLLLKRRIRHVYGSDHIEIEDTIINEAYQSQPYMLLYHFNVGYPLLSENAELNIPSKTVTGRTANAQENIDTWNQFTAPVDCYPERCYYHQNLPNENGRVQISLANPDCDTRLLMDYDGLALDHFVQWKVMESGIYVVGLEPCNASIEGRAKARRDASLKTLAPGERISIRTAFSLSSY